MGGTKNFMTVLLKIYLKDSSYIYYREHYNNFSPTNPSLLDYNLVRLVFHKKPIMYIHKDVLLSMEDKVLSEIYPLE